VTQKPAQGNRSISHSSDEAVVTVPLTAQQARALVRVAHHYERSMGLTRHIVRLTAAREVRARYAFIARESAELERLAETIAESIGSDGGGAVEVQLTPLAAVSFWGRLLSSLNTRRSRRRLSVQEIEQREALAASLHQGIASLAQDYPEQLEEVLKTRRPAEVDWMRAALFPVRSDS
jgi:hypothetical protein